MNIKNWTVTTQRIKNKGDGLAEYASYLVSQKHQNHRETNIIPISGSFNSFVNNTIKETLEFDKNNKKGGRKVESYAQSFNFILPSPHKPSTESWQKIANDLLKIIHQELEIKAEYKKFGSACFLNVHDQTNPHLNMLIPRIFDNERLADLDRKNVLAKLKLQFNQSVLKHCEIDHTHHKPLRKNTGRRKNKQLYEYENAKKVIEEGETSKEELHKIKIETERKTNELKELQKESDIKLRDLAVKEKELIKKEEKVNVFFRFYKKFKTALWGFVNGVKDDSVLDTMVHRKDLEEVTKDIAEHKLISDEDAKLIEDTAALALDDLSTVKAFEKPNISSRFRTKP